MNQIQRKQEKNIFRKGEFFGKHMIRYAKSQGFAIPQMNINGLIWIEGVLQAAENMQSPIIIGTTDKNIAYLGGYKFILQTIKIKLQRWV